MSRSRNDSSLGGILPPSAQSIMVLLSALAIVMLLGGYLLLSGKINSAERSAKAARDEARALRKKMSADTGADTEAQIISLRAGMKRLDKEVTKLSSRLESMNAKLANKKDPKLEEALAGLTSLASDLDKVNSLAKKTAAQLVALKVAPDPAAAPKPEPADNAIAARIDELESALTDLSRKLANAPRTRNQPKINEDALRKEIANAVEEEIKKMRESWMGRRRRDDR